MSNFIDLSIIVPAYNEELRIPPTLERLHAFLSAQPLRYEIVVVDDGSRDQTCEVVLKHAETMPGLRLVRQIPNRGKGAAVRRGMLEARGQIRVMCDADGSMPPEQLPRLLAPIIACKAEIAIGSRYAEGAKTAKKQPRVSRAVEPALQQGDPALARAGRARHAVRGSKRSPRRRRATCSRSHGSTAGRSISRSWRSRSDAAIRSPRSVSSGPMTVARGSIR